MIRIAVDGNGGDYGLDTTVLGSMSKTLKKRLERLKPSVWWEET